MKVWNFVPETQLNSCMMLAQKNIKFDLIALPRLLETYKYTVGRGCESLNEE